MVTDISPPRFLQLLADEQRWRLLRELARSDRKVSELKELVGIPQNLASYHLAGLRNAGIVSSRRSSADRRDTYYRIDMRRCADLLCEVGPALQPGLSLDVAGPRIGGGRASRRKPGVLFLCTGNSARSQMAEALLEHLSSGTIRALSAGSHPRALHPNAVRVMAERGIDISARATKHLDRFTKTRFDRVITLCDKVREICPEFDGGAQTAHWSMPDPVSEGATEEASYAAFMRTAEELEGRIRFLISELNVRKEGGSPMDPNETVNVRYIVDDVPAAVDFYTRHFGFVVNMNAAPAFADVVRGNLRVLLSGPLSSAGRPMPDGVRPEPGGWNRIHLITKELDDEVARLKAEGVPFRNDVVTGPGGRQILVQDPAGNFIELFQPATP